MEAAPSEFGKATECGLSLGGSGFHNPAGLRRCGGNDEPAARTETEPPRALGVVPRSWRKARRSSTRQDTLTLSPRRRRPPPSRWAQFGRCSPHCGSQDDYGSHPPRPVHHRVLVSRCASGRRPSRHDLFFRTPPHRRWRACERRAATFSPPWVLLSVAAMTAVSFAGGERERRPDAIKCGGGGTSICEEELDAGGGGARPNPAPGSAKPLRQTILCLSGDLPSAGTCAPHRWRHRIDFEQHRHGQGEVKAGKSGIPLRRLRVICVA